MTNQKTPFIVVAILTYHTPQVRILIFPSLHTGKRIPHSLIQRHIWLQDPLQGEWTDSIILLIWLFPINEHFVTRTVNNGYQKQTGTSHLHSYSALCNTSLLSVSSLNIIRFFPSHRDILLWKICHLVLLCGSKPVITLPWESVGFSRMIKKPREGNIGELKFKTFPRGAWPRTPQGS